MLNFFGLPQGYRQQLQQQIFNLCYHSNFTYVDVYHYMTIPVRLYQLKLLNKQLELEKNASNTSEGGDKFSINEGIKNTKRYSNK